jgi:hypothetical protein
VGKKYEREERTLERLHLDNKRLKEENRHLHKKLKELNKGYYKFLFSDSQEDKEEAIQQAKQTAIKICYTCNIGQYKEIIILNRRWRECQNCGKRGKTKII